MDPKRERKGLKPWILIALGNIHLLLAYGPAALAERKQKRHSLHGQFVS